MRTRFFLPVLVAVAMVATGFMNSGLAAAPAEVTTQVSASSSAGLTCSTPPDDPDATAENRDRFVSLWSARMADKEWLDNWIELKTVPSEVAAEGFHAMSGQVQYWLNTCLLDDMLATAKETPTAAKRGEYMTGLNMVIFGKKGIQDLKEELSETTSDKPSPQKPVPSNLTPERLSEMADDLSGQDGLTSGGLPKSDAQAPSPTVSENLAGHASETLKARSGASTKTTTSTPKAAAAPSLAPQGLEPNPITQIPLVPLVLSAVNALLQLIAKIQAILFTLPVVNVLASAFYKICAESATMPLSCSISLPVGVPIPADVTGDNVPDVLGALFPVTNLKDVGAKFQVTRMHSAPLPAHVFAVYDTPIVKKRIEVGFDGRASSLAYNQGATFTVKNVAAALTGDVQVGAVVTAAQPGSTEALTFAVKDLVGGSAGVPASEENPVAGAVQMNPFPEKFTVDGRLTHTNSKDQDTFKVTSTVPTTVDAQITQKTTTTSPKSNRVFTALIDKLPTEVTVDLTHQGEKQVIDYTANAAIGHVQVSDTATGDVSHPGSFTRTQADVFGLPTHVNVALQGAQDITYTANGNIPTASFSTQTKVDNVLQQQIDAAAHQIPKSIHVTNLTTNDEQAITYDADSNLGDIQLGMYDKSEAGDETNLVASATSIPTHIGFTMKQSTGVYDFAANQGIGKINATLTRNGGSVIPHAGDHATVLKSGDQLGLDFQLSGFKSAHFDGHEDTTVSLGLDPGGQSFDAIADLDDPNILATAHIEALPSSVAVTFDPDNGSATYTADRVIPELDASFTNRDTQMHGDVALYDLPKNIGLTFNTTGKVPQVTYDADSRLGKIVMNYSEKPGGLAVHGEVIDLPKYMKIGGIDPIVFDARTGAAAAPASSEIGQIRFDYASDGTFQHAATADDHALLNTVGGQTHAELVYSGLRYISVNTANQELHAAIKNSADRLFRAYLTTDTLTATAFIDKVPDSINIDQVGKLITYTASDPIDEIFTNVQTQNGDSLQVDVTDVPTSVSVLFDGPNSHLQWASSAVAGGFSAVAHLSPTTLGTTRAFDAELTISDIPTAWDATWPNGNVTFTTNGTGIGAIDARVTNHTSYHTLPGDHLNAYFNQNVGSAPGDLDASLHISNLQSIGYTKLTGSNGGGFLANLNMGSHGQLNFGADVTLSSGPRLIASGNFTHLPSHIVLKSDGGRITYTGDDNPTLTLAVGAGQTSAALAATPPAPPVHGVSVRDGQDGSGNKAVRANLFLTGLPDNLDLNSPAGTYAVNGFHPTQSPLVVDAKLNTLAPQPLTLLLTQEVPTVNPINFTFGPFLSSTAGDGTHNLSLDYTANQDLGKLTAEATYGNTDDAKLEISEIPKHINVHAAFGAETKTVGVTMDHDIAKIVASYRHVGDADFGGVVELDDVPKTVDITIGSETAADGTKDVTAPQFTMTADHAGLDIHAHADASLFAGPAAIDAGVKLEVIDLGQTVTGGLDGTTLRIGSTPATGSFLLSAAGHVGVNANLDFGGDGTGFTNDGELNVNVDVHEVTLGFTQATTLRLDLGVTTGLQGDYDNFTFVFDTDTDVHIYDDLDFFIDWPDPFGTSNIDLFYINKNIHFGDVLEGFHLNTNTFGTIFSVPVFFFVIGECDVDFKVRPAPGGTTDNHVLSLGQPPSEPGYDPAWLITPDLNLLGLSLPDFAMDIIAYFLTPYGHQFKVTSGCHVYDLNPF